MSEVKTAYHEEDGKEYVSHRADGLAEHAKIAHELRGSKAKSERIGEWHHKMHLPNIIILDAMSKTGLNFFEPDHNRELLRYIWSNYPEFRATDHNL